MKLRIETSKLQVLKLKKEIKIFFETFILELVHFSNLVFTKQITKFVERKFQGRSEKSYVVPDWSFEVSILIFILNLEVSDQSLNRFDCKRLKLICLRLYLILISFQNLTMQASFSSSCLLTTF